MFLIKCLMTLAFVVFYFVFVKSPRTKATVNSEDPGSDNGEIQRENRDIDSEEQIKIKENVKRAHANITEIEMCLNMILQREDPIAVKDWCTEELSIQHDYLKLSEIKQVEPPPSVVPFHKSRYNVCIYK